MASSNNSGGEQTFEMNDMFETLEEIGAAAVPPQPSVSRVPVQEPVSNRVLELRLRLCNLLALLRMSETFKQLNNPTNNEVDRAFKNSSFHQIYETVSELLSNGHYAYFLEHRYESLIIASIDLKYPSKDVKDKWHVVIEDSIAFYLDVFGQFICPNNQFRKEILNSCPLKMAIRLASFEGSMLILSKPIASCSETSNIIYGIRCTSEDAASKAINYVGQVEKESAHSRVCTNHHADAKRYPRRKMYSHVKEHNPDQDPDFRGTMEMIYLPIPPKKIYYNYLNSWECFWQFFFRARYLRGGWCVDFPGDPVKVATDKAMDAEKAKGKLAKKGMEVGEKVGKDQESFDKQDAEDKE